MVLVISLQVVPPSTDDCHFTTLPVLPDKVSVPLLEPVQTEVDEDTVPPTDTGSTVMVTAAVFSEEQTPLFTTARYWVV